MCVFLYAVPIWGYILERNVSVKELGDRQSENYIYTLLNLKEIKDDLDDEYFIERINYDLKKSIEYKKFVKQQEESGTGAERLRQMNIPVLQEFISTN